MELISPTLEKEKEFLRLVGDFEISDPDNAEYYLAAKKSFSNYVKSLNDEAQGINLPEGYVPCNHYWLLNETGDISGIIRIRHNIDNPFLSLEGGHIGYDIAPSFRRKGYGTKILKLGLVKASLLGLKKVLVTADDDNAGSRKIIESSGGLFEQIIMGNVFPNPIARYWINL